MLLIFLTLFKLNKMRNFIYHYIGDWKSIDNFKIFDENSIIGKSTIHSNLHAFSYKMNDVLKLWRIDRLLSMGLLASFHLNTSMDLLLVNNKIYWNFDNTRLVGWVNFHFIGDGSRYPPSCNDSLQNFLFPFFLCNKILMKKIIKKII